MQERPKTKIIQCTCNHKYQNSKYGKNNRVYNRCISGYKCSVCGEKTK